MDSDGQDETPVLDDKSLPQIIITPPTPTVLTVLHKDKWQRTGEGHEGVAEHWGGSTGEGEWRRGHRGGDHRGEDHREGAHRGDMEIGREYYP